MCFSILRKVKKATKTTALLEDGKIVTLGKEVSVVPGQYVQVQGNLAVGVVTKKEGEQFFALLKSLTL